MPKKYQEQFEINIIIDMIDYLKEERAKQSTIQETVSITNKIKKYIQQKENLIYKGIELV